MDALTALRQAIIAGRDGDIKEEAPDLVIAGARYPGDTPTAFRQSRNGPPYPLLAVWLQWKLRSVSVQELIKAATTAKTRFVLITDKNVLIDYLRGKSEAADFIDASKLGMPVPANLSQPQGERSGGDEGFTLDAALRKEIPYRTRASVLQASDKNLRDTVFKHFQPPKQAGEEGGEAAGAAPSAGRSSSSAAAAGDAAASRKRGRPGDVASSSAAPGAAPGGSDAFGGWRGTPIIIIPASSTSLINMYNVMEFLGEGKFVPPIEARAAKGSAPKPTKLVLKRKDSRGNSCQYYIVDSVEGLQRSDWVKVAAVFALGPEWQFKGWRWGREDRDPKTGAYLRPDVNPTEIFERAQGFHVQFEDDVPHENIPKWAVVKLGISKARRYTDASVAQKFWSALDNYIFVKKPYLLPKGVSNVASATPMAADAK